VAFEPHALSDREKAVLRLLGEGHDAKSTAGKLGISVNAVNERLRGARRKLGLSSSREAARLLASFERQSSDFLVDKKKGVVVPTGAGERQTQESKGGRHTFAFAVGGICTVLLVVVIGMLATTPSETAASGPLPNWSLQAALPGKLSRQSNRIYLSGNRLLWNGEEVSEANIRTFLSVETQMNPQPLTILSYGSQVPGGRIQRTHQLIDGVLHCKPATCLEVTNPVIDDGAEPEANPIR
jgi:DNA-binding CsgD family transcriptional regulator